MHKISQIALNNHALLLLALPLTLHQSAANLLGRCSEKVVLALLQSLFFRVGFLFVIGISGLAGLGLDGLRLEEARMRCFEPLIFFKHSLVKFLVQGFSLDFSV